jgi:PPOX class probable F420-dependent enzyme
MVELNSTLRAFLEERRFAVAATINKDGSPQQTVVWYELQGERIMMNTRVGRVKEKNLRRDQRISFCVEDEYRYLTLKGRVEFDDDRERGLAGITALAVRYHGAEKAERLAREQYSKQERVNIYMTIESFEAYGFE